MTNSKVKIISVEKRLLLNKFNIYTKSHIEIDFSKCEKCELKPCILICPAGLYELVNGKLTHNYEGCLECGACRIVCPYNAIKWDYPPGGYGVCYQFG